METRAKLRAPSTGISVSRTPSHGSAPAEVPASGSAYAQGWAGGPVWPGSSGRRAAVLLGLGPQSVGHTGCGSCSTTLLSQGGRSVAPPVVGIQDAWPENVGSRGAYSTAPRGQGAKPAGPSDSSASPLALHNRGA